MSYLLYAIVSRGARPVLPPGVGGASVSLIEQGDLGAAVSAIDPTAATPDIPRLLSFSKVVEVLHAHRTIVPMRYGCLVDEAGQVIDLLRTRGEDYATILRRLEGCVEMGVRILPPVERPPLRRDVGPEIESPMGRAYLTDRAARYAQAEAAARALTAPMEQVRRALGGLASLTSADADCHAGPAHFASLYFLVKREMVESFRDTFRWIERTTSAGLLLSGPWPPYNFVTPPVNGHADGG